MTDAVLRLSDVEEAVGSDAERSGKARRGQDLARRVLIVGGTSDIGTAIMSIYRQGGFRVMATVRGRVSEQDREVLVRDNAIDSVMTWDADDPESDEALVRRCSIGDIDEVVITVGSMAGDLAELVTSNFVGPGRLAAAVAMALTNAANSGGKRWARPRIVLIGSVAGDRGRASNGGYGAAKAGLAAFASALGQRYRGIDVLLVKPGFVQTKMLGDRVTPGFLTATPEEVAERVFYGPRGGEAYVGAKWWLIMAMIKSMPRFIFNRMSF